jgi:hypothetical protein
MATFDLLEDIKSLLTGITSDIYKNEMPETPVSVITLYNTSGLDPQHTFGAAKAAWEKPGFQVVVRHATAGTARTWMESIKNALDGKVNFTVNTHYYLSVFQQGDIFSLGRDKENHAIKLSLNFLVEVTR